MADQNSESLDIRHIEDASDLLKFLADHSLLSNLEDFRLKFLGLLITYLKESSDEQRLFIGGETLIAGEIFYSLPALLDEDEFFTALKIPPPTGKRLDPIKADFDLSILDLSERFNEALGTSVRTVARGNSGQASEKIRRLARQLTTLSGTSTAEAEPEYETAVRTAVSALQSDLAEQKRTLLEILSPSVEALTLEKEVRNRLETRWRSLESKQAAEEKEQVSQKEKEQRKALSEKLKKWNEDVTSLRDAGSHEKIAELQRDHEIQGLLGQKGILEQFLLWTGGAPPRDLIESLVRHCISFIEPFTPRPDMSDAQRAVPDAAQAKTTLFEALKELKKFLEEERKQKIEEAEKAFSEAVAQTILGDAPSADGAETGTGGGDAADSTETPEEKEKSPQEEPENAEPPKTKDVTLDELIALWLTVQESWKSAGKLFQDLEDNDPLKGSLLELLTANKLRPEYLLAAKLNFRTVFETLTPENRARSYQQAEKILELLNQLFPEAKEVVPKKTADTAGGVQALQTAFGSGRPLDSQEEKLFTLGEISRAKAELVSFTMLQLQRELLTKGYSEQEVAQYLKLYQAQISSQIWMAMLEKNGLKKELKLRDIAEVSQKITAQYLMLIPKAFPKAISIAEKTLPQLDEEDQLRQFLAARHVDPDAYLQHFSAESIKRALLLTKEFSSLSLPERLKIAAKFLQQDHSVDESTATQLAQLFLQLSAGGSVVEYTVIFDQLANSLYGKNHWNELTSDEQTKISGLFAHFYDNLAIFGLIFGLSELRLLQSEVAKLQILIQRMSGQQEKLAAMNNHPLFQFVGSELAGTTADDPSARGEGPVDSETESGADTRNVTLQVSVLFAVDIKVESREALLTLVMQRPVSMKEFGSLLEYVQTGQEQEEPIDPNLLAEFENLQSQQQANPAEFAAQQQTATQAFSETQQTQKQIQLAIQLAQAASQAYAGNPTALIALLSDKQNQKMILETAKKVAVGGTVVTALPALAFLQGASALLTSLGLISGGSGAAGAMSAASSALSPASLAASEAARDAVINTSAGVSREVAAVSNGLKDLGSTLAKVPGQASSLVSTLGVGKGMAMMAFSAIFGPMLLAGTLTIIVITVIGSSLNDLPFGGIPYTQSGNRILNTTDMACIELDAGSFRSAGLGADVQRIQAGIIQAMRSEYARIVCDIIPSGKRIMVAYNNGWNWGGHTSTAYGHEIGLSRQYIVESREWPATSMQYTLFHEMGHIFTKYTDIKQRHNQAMGAALVRSYDGYDKTSDRQEESTAEGLAWFLFLPVVPNVYTGTRDVNLPREYPALTAAYEQLFATLSGR